MSVLDALRKELEVEFEMMKQTSKALELCKRGPMLDLEAEADLEKFLLVTSKCLIWHLFLGRLSHQC